MTIYTMLASFSSCWREAQSSRNLAPSDTAYRLKGRFPCCCSNSVALFPELFPHAIASRDSTSFSFTTSQTEFILAFSSFFLEQHLEKNSLSNKEKRAYRSQKCIHIPGNQNDCVSATKIWDIWYSYPYQPGEIKLSGTEILLSLLFCIVWLEFWTGITPARYVRNILAIRSTWSPTGTHSEAVAQSGLTKNPKQLHLNERFLPSE